MSQARGGPTGQGLLHRPRLDALIEKGLQNPLLVMLAGPGYGKTQAMIDYLSACGTRTLWLHLSSLDNLNAHFWNHLIRTLKIEFPYLSGCLQTMEFPNSLAEYDAFLHLLSESIEPEQPVIWVLDDFGEIENQAIKDFVRLLVEAELAHFRLVLISNELSSTESIAFLSSKRFLILEKDLRFTKEEIAELYALHGIPTEAEEIKSIERYTEGWPLPLHLLVLQNSTAPALVSPDGRLTHYTISHMFEERFFSTYPPSVRTLLLKLSFLNSFTKDLMVELYEGKKADLEPLWNHVFIKSDPTSGKLFLHYLYLLFLQDKKYLLSEEEEQALWKKAGAHYVSSGNPMEAITCYRKSGEHIRMLEVLTDFALAQFDFFEETARFILDHLALLTEEEIREHPVADFIRIHVYTNLMWLDKAETLALDLERRLFPPATEDARILLGNIYVELGLIYMTYSREDFGEYFEKAAGHLQGGSSYHPSGMLRMRDIHCFVMPDNRPGTLERMDKAIHYAVPWVAKTMDGCMSGIEHLYSAEAAYLTYHLKEAQQHAYRAIYKAEAHAQHDIACNAHCLMARIGLMHGDYAEMTTHIQSVEEYATKYEMSVLNEIRDTARAWYYTKLRDLGRVPRSISSSVVPGRPTRAYGRSQIVYANYLLHTGEHAKLVGMLEHMQGSHPRGTISHDRIFQQIMLSIGHSHLGNRDAAMEALWFAYDMCHHNGLTTLFIEGEATLAPLLEAAGKQQKYEFDKEWLADILEQATGFAKRAAAVRAAYRKQYPEKVKQDNPLTKREMEVLQALSVGMTREEISSKQFISVNTVKTFIRSIYNKLNAANRAEAISIAISHGYLDMIPRQ